MCNSLFVVILGQGSGFRSVHVYHSPLLHLQESLFFVAQALTTLHWSRLSDHVGRKPVLLIGLMGLSISNVCFGLSTTFWTIVAR